MMFVIVIETPLSSKVIGPFPHEEDARTYAEHNCKLNLWWVSKLEAPAK